jgi:hypothetical protein
MSVQQDLMFIVQYLSHCTNNNQSSLINFLRDILNQSSKYLPKNMHEWEFKKIWCTYSTLYNIWVCSTHNLILLEQNVLMCFLDENWKIWDSGDAEVNIIVDWVRLEEVFIIVSYAVEIVCGWMTKVLLGEFGIRE